MFLCSYVCTFLQCAVFQKMKYGAEVNPYFLFFLIPFSRLAWLFCWKPSACFTAATTPRLCTFVPSAEWVWMYLVLCLIFKSDGFPCSSFHKHEYFCSQGANLVYNLYNKPNLLIVFWRPKEDQNNTKSFKKQNPVPKANIMQQRSEAQCFLQSLKGGFIKVGRLNRGQN